MTTERSREETIGEMQSRKSNERIDKISLATRKMWAKRKGTVINESEELVEQPIVKYSPGMAQMRAAIEKSVVKLSEQAMHLQFFQRPKEKVKRHTSGAYMD